MPRIPVRTEPYSSPSRQHRHYKNKRDQVLRALGKAAYINGSHFAIMWVSARGDVETYASEALQGRLDDWFIKRGISDEAKELVRQSRNSQTRPAPPPFEIDEELFDEDYEGAGLSDDESRSDGRKMLRMSQSASTTPNIAQTDVFGETNPLRPSLEKSITDSQKLSGLRARRMIAPLDTNSANEQYYREAAAEFSGNGPSFSSSLGMPHTSLGMSFRSPFGIEGASNDPNGFLPVPLSAPLQGDLPLPSPYLGSMPAGIRTSFQRSLSSSLAGSMPQSSALVETTFKTKAARTAFLELRFGQLQQGMCKTVAKAWIKVIEPKKQTRCPYNKGEEGKPDWWPEGVRHKEPDHLMKPERHALLLTILRSPRIRVARLQLATAEVVALIKADKVSLLMDVYRIARAEEKMREAGVEDDATETTVQISTLEGWSEEDQCATAVDRPGSPGPGEGGEGSRSREEDESLSEAKDGGNARKRAGAQIARSASASSAIRSTKRKVSSSSLLPPSTSEEGLQQALINAPRSAGLGGSMNGSNLAVPVNVGGGLNVPRRIHGNAQTWLLHEATRNGIKRTSVSSHTLSGNPAAHIAAANASASWNQQQQQQNQQQVSNANAMSQQSQYNDQSQQLLQQNYGLITPLTGNAQLMDPSFLTAAKEGDMQGEPITEARLAGYMSAPTGHAQLYPHMPFMGHMMNNQTNIYNLHLARNSTHAHNQTQMQISEAQQQQQALQRQEQQQQSQNDADAAAMMQMQTGQNGDGLYDGYSIQNDSSTTESGGALGLHGISNMQWNNAGSSFPGTSNSFGGENAGNVQQMNNSDLSASNWWQGQQAMQSQQARHQQFAQASASASQGHQAVESSGKSTSEIGGSSRANPSINQGNSREDLSMTSTASGNGLTDNSFDHSFASTIESAGPTTPPSGQVQNNSNEKHLTKAHDYSQQIQQQQQQQQQQQLRQQISNPAQQTNTTATNTAMNAFDGWMYGKQG